MQLHGMKGLAPLIHHTHTHTHTRVQHIAAHFWMAPPGLRKSEELLPALEGLLDSARSTDSKEPLVRGEGPSPRPLCRLHPDSTQVRRPD